MPVSPRGPVLHVLLLLCVSLAAAPAAQAAQLAVSWVDNSGDEDGFLVERRGQAAGAFQPVATLGPNAVAFLDTGVAAGTAYCYRVRAFNLAGPSAYSSEGCGTSAAGLLPLSVTLNQTAYRQRDTMIATVQAVGGLVPSAVDAYVVVQTAGGLLSLQLDGRLVQGLVPIVRGIVLPTVAAPFAFPLAGAPPGTYTWLAGVTTPGTLGLLAPIASTTFTIAP